MATEPYSPDNPKHVKSRAKREAIDALLDETAVNWIMSDPRGRRALRAVIAVGEPSSNAFNVLATRTAFNLGRQYSSQELTENLKRICPTEYLEMVKEHLLERLEAGTKDEAVRTVTKLEDDGAKNHEASNDG
ncbi:MAG: hypothetical protein EXR86_12415 [Gammaproteobacteria bacterium]|nr:hypothetical protein [Gammaproteobacteria bacterium]